jgi:hypothetical protein
MRTNSHENRSETGTGKNPGAERDRSQFELKRSILRKLGERLEVFRPLDEDEQGIREG